MERVIVGNVGGAQLEPARGAFAAAEYLRLMGNHRAHGYAPCPALRAEVGFEKREDLLPAVDRLLLPVRGPVVIEESVAGAGVAVKFVGLAVRLQSFLMFVHLRQCRRLILLAEKPQQRAHQVLRVVDRRHRLFLRQFLLGS